MCIEGRVSSLTFQRQKEININVNVCRNSSVECSTSSRLQVFNNTCLLSSYFKQFEMKIFVVITVIAFATLTFAVQNIRKCDSAKKPEDTDINISKCDKPPCLLKRRTSVDVDFKIKPDKDIKTITNTVYGRIAGLPLPFVGVDNTNACDQVFNAKGEKVGCPLKAGEEYTYKNVIKILNFYPKVSVDVHWALTGTGNQDLFCFEVPARITS